MNISVAEGHARPCIVVELVPLSPLSHPRAGYLCAHNPPPTVGETLGGEYGQYTVLLK